MSRFRVELKRALQKTSLKGFPRILSAKKKVNKVIWIVAVLVLLGICIFNAYNNVSSYLQYEKVIDVEEKRIDFSDPNGNVPFPTVTVCNLNQFGSNQSVFVQNGIPSFKDYIKTVQERTICENCPTQMVQLMNRIHKTLYSVRGYYQYIGQDSMNRIGNQNLIVDCHVIVRVGSSLLLDPCHEVTKNYSYILPDTGLCYSFEPALMERGRTIIGYKFILFTDSVSQNLNTEFDPYIFPQAISGALVNLIDPSAVPKITESSAILPTGMSTRAFMKAVKIERISTPYSEQECMGQNHNTVDYNGRRFNYDFAHSLSTCIIRFIEERCECVDLFLMHTVQMAPPAFDYCSSIKRNRSELYKKVTCAEHNKLAAEMACRKLYKEACQEITYKLSVSSGRWPLPSQLLSFYQNFISKNPFLLESFEKEYPSNTTPGKADIMRYVENNFAEANVVFASMYYTHYKAKPKTYYSSLIAELGGTLNLWCGITMVIFVEIIDLIVTLIWDFFYPEEGQKDIKDNKPVDKEESGKDVRQIYYTTHDSNVKVTPVKKL